MVAKTTYELGAGQAEQDRLRSQAEGLEANARWLFDRLDLRPGARVLDVGCGPRGVLDLLAARVGEEGRVVGLDQSPVMLEQARAFVAASELRNVELVHADATATGLPEGSFDAVHARLVLVNVPPKVAPKIVAEMMRLVRPGGVVALQEIDGASFSCDPPHPAWDTVYAAVKRVISEGNMGRTLPRLLREAGAVDVQGGAHATFCPPGHPWRTLLLQLSDATRARAVDLGLVVADELDAARAALRAHLDDPDTAVLAPVLGQAWGRRPG